ncbi:MAG: helix-turn-helix transcriptional regulator [Kiritimatiellaeota bacterium]|nr:helix-turn-helix transcriptional regulator [Kiritimatiellota bacterium]
MDFDQCACSGKTLNRFVRPMILALLLEKPVHGYDLLRQLQKLKMFEEAPPDTSGVYKTLKTMTAEGLTVGEWDTAEAGPARRPFTITSKGRTCLLHWAETLERYQQEILDLSVLVNAAIRGAETNAAKKPVRRNHPV